MKKELKILLVEDNEGDVRIIKELLKEQSYMTFNVTQAGTLSDAVNKLTVNAFDTILLDLGLPDSTGYETFSKLITLYPNLTAIIILTGLNDTETGLKAVYRGAQDYIIKGQIDSEKLVKSIIYSFERQRLNIELKEQLEARRKVEEELIAEREKLNLIAKRTSAAMYHLGLEGFKFGYIHEAIETLTGYTAEEINSIGFENLIRRIEMIGGKVVDLSFFPSLWEEKKKKDNTIEYLIETKNGDLKWLNDKSYPLSNDSGEIQGSIGILMDISFQKEAEIEMVSQKKRSEQLFFNSPVAIVQLDSEGNILNANSSFENIFGFNKTEVIGENLDQLIVPEELKEDALNFFFETSKGFATNEVSIRKRKNGSIIYVSIAGVPIKIHGENAGFYVMFTDITKQKMAEEALIKSRDKAEESDRLKTAFMHNISHEIRTPMNAIVGFSALLDEPSLDEESRKSFIDTIVQSSNHLLTIINDIVEISNIEARLVKISKDSVDLNSIIKSITGIFQLKAREKNKPVKIFNKVPEFSTKIITDNTKLYQIISNLVNNALKFTASGKIEIGYSRVENFIEFFVADTGIGIAERFQTRIFDRFYQVEYSESRQFEGTGLGLSICKAYVELLGGTIWVTSEPEKGSIFSFKLPCEDILTTLDQDHIIKPMELNVKGRKKILVAEDIESNFKLIKYYLSTSDVEIIMALNGKEAVDYFRSNPDVALILMDIKMPVMDGYTAIKRIREMNKTIPIIATDGLYR